MELKLNPKGTPTQISGCDCAVPFFLEHCKHFLEL